MIGIKLHIVIAGIHFKSILDYLRLSIPNAVIQMIEPDKLLKYASSTDILIPTLTWITEEFFSSADNLILVQQWGVGIENIDINAATRYRVPVSNVPSHEIGSAESVAEWCVMVAIALSRQLLQVEKQVKTYGPWGSPVGQSLRSCKIITWPFLDCCVIIAA